MIKTMTPRRRIMTLAGAVSALQAEMRKVGIATLTVVVLRRSLPSVRLPT